MYRNEITINQIKMLKKMNEYSISEKDELRPKWLEESERAASVVPILGIKYIKCPYSFEEREKILEWIDLHQYDAKALAVALWLSGGITPQEITNLRRVDYQSTKSMDIVMESEKREIVRKALKLHPEGLEFVFMFQKGYEWKKLKGTSIQMKMYHICDEIGIIYKPFHKNEAIQYDV